MTTKERGRNAYCQQTRGYGIIVGVLTGVMRIISVWTRHKRCKAIVQRNLGTFNGDDTVAEVNAHACVPLFVFHHRHPKASLEIGERPFFSPMVAGRIHR